MAEFIYCLVINIGSARLWTGRTTCIYLCALAVHVCGLGGLQWCAAAVLCGCAVKGPFVFGLGVLQLSAVPVLV